MNIFKNKILLVTGGTGSFGNAVIGKFLKFNLKEPTKIVFYPGNTKLLAKGNLSLNAFFFIA